MARTSWAPSVRGRGVSIVMDVVENEHCVCRSAGGAVSVGGHLVEISDIGAMAPGHIPKLNCAETPRRLLIERGAH